MVGDITCASNPTCHSETAAASLLSGGNSKHGAAEIILTRATGTIDVVNSDAALWPHSCSSRGKILGVRETAGQVKLQPTRSD